MARRRRTRRWPWIPVFLLLLAAVVLLQFRRNGSVSGAGKLARVTIPVGATLDVVAESLQAARVIRSARVFRTEAMLRGSGESPIQPGRYVVQRGASTTALLEQLRNGTNRFRRLTIPEGWGIRQIARLMQDSLGIDSTELFAAARDSARRARMQTKAPDVEGYLFPATYDFTDDVTPAGVVDTMLLTFERRWKSAWDTALTRQGRSRHDVVTLASIVEKEAGRDEDRAMIASVYANRLRAGMRLQADPTVLYAMKLVAKRVMYADLRVDSPYNTYRVSGLPPGPIASPGTASLAAAIEPATSDAMFFVAFPDGHSEFTKTFAQHSAAVKASRQARDAAATSP
ncbi:MAG TPA: endolytic transglycosylase MltG [Gemmatimonadaceae bacterium]|nr:endolytic transglycosylase MltG [Gemmatimonadaceae bacterium]